MFIGCKFKFGDKVRHRLNTFEGWVIGVTARPQGISYEVLPITDSNASWRDSIWIDEQWLCDSDKED
jgi:heat shock protein HspQ